MLAEQSYDVIVVGGGPAGSTAASVLARAGKRVVVLERTRFPRYHVGESLLPYAWWTLDRIGALELVKAQGFQSKRSVQFVSANGNQSRPFEFTDHLDHESAHSWQVDRAHFDAVMLEHAEACGATVLHQTKAVQIVEDDGRMVGVVARTPDGDVQLNAPWTIDCSGRDGFVRGQRGWSNPEKNLDRLSLWSYYEGVPVDKALSYATTVVQAPADGWYWFIPMAGGKVSVGVVAKREALFASTKDKLAAYEAAVANNPWLAAKLSGATRIKDVQVTSDYSYRSTYCADDGVVLAGDAFAFLDPVFSSGVFLALRTGEQAANTVLEALQAGRTDAAAAEAYGTWMCQGIEAMRSLVFSFYDPKFNMGRLVKRNPELVGDVTDVLIGNLFRDFAELQRALAREGSVPTPLGYGRARQASA